MNKPTPEQLQQLAQKCLELGKIVADLGCALRLAAKRIEVLETQVRSLNIALKNSVEQVSECEQVGYAIWNLAEAEAHDTIIHMGGAAFRVVLYPLGEADDNPTSTCPKCGQEVLDLDGLGVVRHEDCGYCAHPSSTGGVCDICGEANE